MQIDQIASRPIAQTRSQGWDQAVLTAAAHVNDGWVLTETRCDTAEAEELAVLLSAYGMLSDEVTIAGLIAGGM